MDIPVMKRRDYEQSDWNSHRIDLLLRRQFPSLNLIVAGLVLFRLLNGLSLFSFFDPDEFWQGPEVAHWMVFGSGFLTWEWRYALRSYLHPLLLTPPYALLWVCEAIIGDDWAGSSWISAWGCRLWQSGLTAVVDVCVFLLSFQLTEDRTVSLFALFATLSNWFVAFCLPRPYSNSMETVLSIIALYVWIKSALKSPNSLPSAAAILTAALACAVRPTAAVFWCIFAVCYGCFRYLPARPLPFWTYLLRGCLLGVAALGVAVVLDSVFFHRFSIVPLNFLRFNVSMNISHYYGVHPTHWYIFQAIPLVCFTQFPFTVYGACLSWNKVGGHSDTARAFLRSILIACVGFVLVFSLQPHKEFRFLLPILPISCMWTAFALCQLFYSRRGSFCQTNSSDTSNSVLQCILSGIFSPNSRFAPRHVVAALLISNMTIYIYFAMFHQTGTIGAMEYVRRRRDITSLHLFIPCHQSPFLAHLHRSFRNESALVRNGRGAIDLRFLDCEPPPLRHPPHSTSEEDQFFDDPLQFLERRYLFTTDGERFNNQKHTPPQMLMLFDNIQAAIDPFLTKHGYTESARFFHTLTPMDERQSQFVLLVERPFVG